MTALQKDIYEDVTNKIVEQLERGCAPWQKPWTGSASFDMPKNGTTDKHYNGINILLLWGSADEHGFDCQEWGSFDQWRKQKEMVAKGAKGTQIIYYDTIERQKDDKLEKIPFIKSSFVFNRCQLQGYKPTERSEKPAIERHKHADQYIINTGARFNYDGGNRAYYSRATDDIHLPEPEAFKDRESLYSVTFHEIGHWTHKPERCNRQLGKRFGDKEYAVEELVAELHAAFQCSAQEICNEPREDHAAYLGSWLGVMKADKRAIFTAASEASKAVGYLDGLQP